MTTSYELILVSLGDDVPADVRMKRLLKLILRAYRFRCRSVKRIDSRPAKKGRSI